MSGATAITPPTAKKDRNANFPNNVAQKIKLIDEPFA
jgi:hypothetical protein